MCCNIICNLQILHTWPFGFIGVRSIFLWNLNSYFNWVHLTTHTNGEVHCYYKPAIAALLRFGFSCMRHKTILYVVNSYRIELYWLLFQRPKLCFWGRSKKHTSIFKKEKNSCPTGETSRLCVNKPQIFELIWCFKGDAAFQT